MIRCRVCGEQFSPHPEARRAYFCGDRCRGVADRAREIRRGTCTDESGCTRGVRARGLCVTHYNRAFQAGSQKQWPGDPDRRRQALRRKTQRRRAVVRGLEAETIDRDVVGDRDGWRCGICRRRVNRRLPYPHPRSPSLDHIIPISEGGGHVYANVRISHLECNLARGNRGGGEQLALIG